MTTVEIKNQYYDHKFKLMMLGDAGVGKTSITRRFVDDAFASTYIHTIGIDFLEKVVKTEENGAGGKNVLLQIWDTAGQDRYRFNANLLLLQNIENETNLK